MEGQDAQQAYLQADIPDDGVVTYIVYPKELWTPEMHEMRCPVSTLRKHCLDIKALVLTGKRSATRNALMQVLSLSRTVGLALI